MPRVCWWVVPLMGGSLLSGCAVPPAVTVASLAADGVSYVATGKSVTDHGLSAATGEDCALLRVVRHQSVCSNDWQRGKNVPVEAGKASVPPPAAESGPAPVAIARDRYVALGSFLDPGNAARTAARYAALHPTITRVEVGGRRFHRVIVGPLSAAEAAALKARLVAGQDPSPTAG